MSEVRVEGTLAGGVHASGGQDQGPRAVRVLLQVWVHRALTQIMPIGGVQAGPVFLLWAEGPHREGVRAELEGLVQKRRELLRLWVSAAHAEGLPNQTQGADILK